MTPAERIQNLSFRSILIFGFLLAVAYYFSMFDDGSAIDAQIKTVDIQVKTAQAELENAGKIAGDQIKFQAEVDRVSAQLKLALELLPTSAKVEDVLDKMSKEAAAAGVRIISSIPKPAENKGFYDELKVDVVMQGTFPTLTLFLSYISSPRIHRVITLRDIDLNLKNSTTSLLTVHGTLVAYRYVEAK